MDLQQKLGPIFDITFDCEDGASAGNEALQIKLIDDLIQSKDNQFNRIGVRLHKPGTLFLIWSLIQFLPLLTKN